MLNFGLIGCGRIAKRYAEILSSHKVSNAKLSAVCDTNYNRAHLFSNTYQVPCFASSKEMLEKCADKIDVLCILTPSGRHASNLFEIVSYKKHFVVEKPMALKLEDADKMIDVCEANGVKLFVVKQNRYNLAIIKLREALEEGRFGRLIMGSVRVRWSRTQEYYNQDAWRGTWALDGGVFTNQASHHIDLLEWMLGSPKDVFAMSRTALVDIETEDTGVALIHFENGALGVIEATTATRPKDLEGSLSILGEYGSVEIGGFAVNQIKTWNFCELREKDNEILENYNQKPPNIYGFGHIAYLQDVVDCILHDKPVLVDGNEGRKSLKLLTAIYEAVETKKVVNLPIQARYSKLGKN